MTQRIFITVIAGPPGEHLLANGQKMLAEGSVITYVHSLIDSQDVHFYSDHLDLWSMGDSFDRFLRPRTRVQYFDGGSSHLYAIRCDLLRTPPEPRDEEERLLRTLICGAKAFYRRAEPAALLFVLRQVFTSFHETLSFAQPRPNQALQRTAPCVTVAASAAAFPPAMQLPRGTPLSLSLGS